MHYALDQYRCTYNDLAHAKAPILNLNNNIWLNRVHTEYSDNIYLDAILASSSEN